MGWIDEMKARILGLERSSELCYNGIGKRRTMIEIEDKIPSRFGEVPFIRVDRSARPSPCALPAKYSQHDGLGRRGWKRAAPFWLSTAGTAAAGPAPEGI